MSARLIEEARKAAQTNLDIARSPYRVNHAPPGEIPAVLTTWDSLERVALRELRLCDALEEVERRVGELEGGLEKCAGWLGGEYMVYRVHAKHVNTEALGRLLEEIYGVLDAGAPEPGPEAGPEAGEGRK